MSTQKSSISATDALPALVRPRISIILCNYNYARFLEAAIQSAVAQSYPCEVIVLDDGSTDGSREVLARWRDRVRVELRENGGQPAAYNEGFACATGDVVIFLDSDDLLAPDAAAVVAQSFGEGVAKVHFRLALIGVDGAPVGGAVPSVLAHGDVGRQLRRHGVLYASAPGSGNAYRRSVLDRLMPLPVDRGDPFGADFFTIYGVPLFGRVHAIEHVLGSYRMHAAQDAASSSLSFGNAGQLPEEIARVARRRMAFRSWVFERSGGALQLPAELTDFAEAKVAFARAVTEHDGIDRLRHGGRVLPTMLSALWQSKERSRKFRLALSAWGVVSLCLPRRVADPMVRFVANPASRGSWRTLRRASRAG